jgi:hypothetical protein
LTDHRRVILAAAERNRSRSWEMQCGHITDWDEQQFYICWKPKGKDEYCDKCSKWQKKIHKRQAEEEKDQQGFPF